MPKSVLLTQCLQRDFVEPVSPFEPLPNRLHVGHEEAARLLGPDPTAGPLMQLMRWAREQDPASLAVVHVRDWHDPDSPAQRAHLQTFGPHCLRGTPGAAFVFDQGEGLAPNERIVDASGLNDLEGTTLEATLRSFAAGEPLRVAVIGVWTEAKVSFLLYDLATRLGVDELATCSALTASSSRAQHFIALDQLRRILGVNVIDGVAGLVDWLSPGSRLGAAHLPARLGPALELDAEPLEPEDRALVEHLYRESASARLRTLAGGFSGARVFRVESQDALGRRQAPSVLKLGPAPLIGAERAAFERVQEVLGNHAPVVRGYADLGLRAGIKYAYAAMGEGRVRTLKSLVEGGSPVPEIVGVLERVFGEVLEPFYAAARYDRLPLLSYYGFRAFAHTVRPSVERLLGAPVGPEGAGGPDERAAARLLRFYEQELPALPDPVGESHYVCTAHGDLNGANVLLDARDNVWVIDFAHTRPDHHVLRDVAKLENDLLYIMTPLRDEAEFHQGLKLTAALRAVADLAAPLPERPEGVESAALLRTWEILRALRAIAARLVREDRHPLQMDLALLRYAVHTLGFDESDALQRRLALHTAAALAEDVASALAAERRLRVDWVEPALHGGPGALGMTICPGRRDRGRTPAEDAAALAQLGVDHLVCLIGDDELESVGAQDLPAELAARGVRFTQLPIRDQGVPTLADARELVARLLAELGRGERVVVHCMGGLGRTGTVCASALVARGLDAPAAIAGVRRARGPRCVENALQERFVAEFEAHLATGAAPA